MVKIELSIEELLVLSATHGAAGLLREGMDGEDQAVELVGMINTDIASRVQGKLNAALVENGLGLTNSALEEALGRMG